MRIIVLLGSVREGRQGEKVAKWVVNLLKSSPSEIDIDFVDVKELDLPLYNEPLPPLAIQTYKEPKGEVWAKRVGQANGFIFVSTEYNHGYTAAMKNAIDWVGKEWAYKPVSFVSYTGSMNGGVRAMEQLKLVTAQLRMLPLSSSVNISRVQEAFNENGEPVDPQLNEALEKVFTELIMVTQKVQGQDPLHL